MSGRLAALAIAAVVAQTAPAIADDEDVPKREPALAWEVHVDCDAADPTSKRQSGRRCDITVTDEAVFLLEPAAAGAGGDTRLSRLDIATGETRWALEVGDGARIDAYDDFVVVSGKLHFRVYDAVSGEPRFEREGSIAEVNRYGTLLLEEGGEVVALDPMSGAELWRADGGLGAVCRDIVVLSAAAATATGSEPFIVVDHRSGEERWRSDDPYDPRADHMTCGFGPFVYTTDGHNLHEWDAISGWLNWTAAVRDAGAIELYSDVALVRSGAEAETIVAIERDTGEQRWERPAVEVGALVSMIGRVREDASGVFTLHPLTGDIVNHTELPTDAPFEVVTSSETRLVVLSGTVVASYGMNDLGTAWRLDLGETPDEVAVGAGHLLVRIGPVLRAYA